ncbi:diguanylate cyclase domain-containing protein [Nitrospira sp. Nam80]
MSQPSSDGDSADIRVPAAAGEADGEDGRPGAAGASGLWWPGRAMDRVRVWCGIDRYVIDGSQRSPHVAWAVGSAGLLSAALFLLIKSAKLFAWPKSPRTESTPQNMATYDSVTGLPMQRLFMLLANQAVSRARKSGRQVAVLLVELDHFILADELQGTLNNNLVYRVQAARIKSALRTTDTVARLGERSFVALLDNIDDRFAVLSVATKIQATISLPFILEGHEIFLTSRIGIALLPPDATDARPLLDLAAQAVAQARTEGYVMFGLPGDSAVTLSDRMTGVRSE